MTIAKVCLASEVADWEGNDGAKTFEFEIPEVTTPADQKVFPDASTVYVTAPVSGDGTVTCSQTFTYVLQGGDNPSELTLGADGRFTLTNEPTTQEYVVDVTVVTTDGTNPVETVIQGIKINKVCGEGSTTLEPPTMAALFQPPGLTPLLTTGGAFTSTNTYCPVVEHTLLSEATEIDLTTG
jgi:hypothetical protein